MVKYEDVKNLTTEEYFNNNQFSIDAFKKKYAINDKETYIHALKRVCDFVASVEKTDDLKKYWSERWFDEIFDGWWHPAGSIMQGAGSGKKISLANCFSQDTTFITDKGVKEFSDFDDGDEVNVLTNYGGYKNATVKNFGKQKLYKLTVSRNGIYKEVKCTIDHVWRTLKKDTIINKTTGNLEVGDLLPYIKRKSMGNGVDLFNRYFCPIGFIHGMVFGDGYYNKQWNFCSLDLCGDSKQFVKYFKGFDWKIFEQEDRIRISYLPNYMKELPDFDKVNYEYILGFIIGWFAADGTIDSGARTALYHNNIDNLIKIKNILESIGLYSSEIKIKRETNDIVIQGKEHHSKKGYNLYALYFIKDTLFESFFVKESHLKNYKEYIENSQKDKSKVQWKVISVDETDLYEDVWCVVEPETENFTLSGGLNTHNCTTISMGTIDEKNEWDNLESIFKNTAYTVAKTAAYRQGLGVDFCLSPDTLILTSDLKQIPIKDINIGDELIGFDEKLNLDKNRLKQSIVESKKIIKRPSYKITTDRGSIIASAEHLWVARNGKTKPDGRMSCKYEWTSTDNLKVGYHLAFSIEPWKEEISKDSGYLAGLLDGEGWISKSHTGIGQNEGIVYDRIVELFNSHNIKYHINENKKCKSIITDGKWESIKLIGMLRPPRLLSKSRLLWENKKLTGQKNPYAKIINIEFLGETDVVALGTSTKTLISNGFLSHNSRLRPKGSAVLNSANESTGAIHWMKLIDSIGYYVGQKGRIPAMLFSLSIKHPDIEEFITVKSDYTKIQNANISVQITDSFYSAVHNNEDWELYFKIPAIKKGDKIFVDIHSIDMNCKFDDACNQWYKIATHDKEKEEIIKKIKAKKLLELIAENMFKNAEPGIQNIDIARKYSNSDAVYNPDDEYDSRIISTNACCIVGESKIMTDRGWLTIEQLYDKVRNNEQFLAMSYNILEDKYELKPIVNAWQKRNDITVTLEIEENSKIYKIECSSDHKVLTRNRGYVEAASLMEEDDIIIYNT